MASCIASATEPKQPRSTVHTRPELLFSNDAGDLPHWCLTEVGHDFGGKQLDGAHHFFVGQSRKAEGPKNMMRSIELLDRSSTHLWVELPAPWRRVGGTTASPAQRQGPIHRLHYPGQRLSSRTANGRYRRFRPIASASPCTRSQSSWSIASSIWSKSLSICL